MNTPAYTADDLATWEAEAAKFGLPLPTDDSGWVKGATVVAATGAAVDNGLVLRLTLRTADGLSGADLLLNPVVARKIMGLIEEGGTSLGWLDHTNDVVVPPTYSGR